MYYSVKNNLRLILLISLLIPKCLFAQFQFNTLFTETDMYITDINTINKDSYLFVAGPKC